MRRIIIHYQPIKLNDELSKINDYWYPQVISEMNDDRNSAFKANGDFIWHEHPNTDKLFIVLEGEMFIDFRDGQVKISKGEMFIVPRGVEHKPFTEKESHIMLVEPKREMD